MKLAEFKRTLKAGDHLTMIDNDGNPSHTLKGERRRVVRTNSVDILIETQYHGQLVHSHLTWPKAADFEITDIGFNINTPGGKIMYRWERA